MRQVTAALMQKQGKILLALRRAGKHMGPKWEFPGGKVDGGETPRQALRRELAEELGIEAEVGEHLGSVRYRRQDLDLEILLYRAEHRSGTFFLAEHEEIRWVAPEDVESFDLVDSDRALYREIKHRLTGFCK